MANSLQVNIPNGPNFSLSGNSDLVKLLTPNNLQGVISILQGNLATFTGLTFNALPTNVETKGSFNANQDLKWDIPSVPGLGLSFGFKAGLTGEILLKKVGEELFSYTQGEDEEDIPDIPEREKDKKITVTLPNDKAAVVVILNVALGVSGGATFSHGTLGVSAGISNNDTFKIANYKCFDPNTNVWTAIQSAFESFVLPFQSSSVQKLKDGDYLEYEFIGKLGVTVGLTYGFGSFAAGRSFGEVSRSLESDLGKIVFGINPTAKAGLSFDLSYDHTDAFRIVSGRHIDTTKNINSASLFIFKMDKSKLKTVFTAGISLSAGANFNIKSNLNDLIDKAANELFGNLPPLAKKAAIESFKRFLNSNEGKRELEKYIKEVNDEVGKLLAIANNGKIQLQIMYERIKQNKVVLNYEFDLNIPNALNSYNSAISGDFRSVVKHPGVSLLPGSYMEDLLIKRTTFSFQFFDVFHFQDITTYFESAKIAYAGNGTFKLRFITGVSHENGRVGHERYAEIYFVTNSITKDTKVFEDIEIKLNFALIDNANRKAARQTIGALEAIGAGTELQAITSRLRATVETDVSLKVKVLFTFYKDAYKSLKSNDFNNNSPTNLPHALDQHNWTVFVNACNKVLVGEGFRGEGFPNLVEQFGRWILYNRTAIDREISIDPPNRREFGNNNTESVWPSDWINISHDKRREMLVYLYAGQAFMNACDDLKHLANDLNTTLTDTAYKQLLKSLNLMIQEDFKVWFTKPILVALCKLTNSQIRVIKAPKPTDTIVDTFEICLEVKGKN